MQTDGFVFAEPVEQNYDTADYISCNETTEGSPSDPAYEITNNNLQYSDNSDLQAAALQRISNLENELQRLREIIKNALQPQITSSPLPATTVGHAKWDLQNRKIVGCNDTFYSIFGVSREELPIFELWMSHGHYPKVKFILEKLNSGAKLVEVKAVFKHPTTHQERCIFLQFSRDTPESNIVSTNVVPLDHYDDEVRVDDYTQFPTISRQCFAVSTEASSIPWQCCCPDESNQL
jgi:PAS domain-containing protein